MLPIIFVPLFIGSYQCTYFSLFIRQILQTKETYEESGNLGRRGGFVCEPCDDIAMAG